MDRKLQRHRADSLRQHGFLVLGNDPCFIAVRSLYPCGNSGRQRVKVSYLIVSYLASWLALRARLSSRRYQRDPPWPDIGPVCRTFDVSNPDTRVQLKWAVGSNRTPHSPDSKVHTNRSMTVSF